ncbi:MAG TPA: SRPBCC family protein [Mucilaginibacter sp.]|nr:SRPBCC family protein [Bacteroidota bacterium]HVS93854.1 SRPBCC family protein [Mucilaginibacter sp.]
MEKTKSSTADRELQIERTLNAPVELVWEVFTKPEHIVNWWGPNGFTNTIYTMDVRPGGEWDFMMHGPDGRDYKNRSVYREVLPLEKIVFDHVNPNFTTTIAFAANGKQTHLKWHMLFETAELFEAVVKAHNAAEGLKQNIEKLNVYLEGLK